MFLDFPLGHTSGRVDEPELNREIVMAALETLGDDQPGHITDLAHRWADTDSWKDNVMRVRTSTEGQASTTDDRTQRHDSPQYQEAADAHAAAASHAGQTCLVCSGIDY